MDGEAGFGRDAKMTKVIYSYKGEEIVEKLCPEKTQYIEEEEYTFEFLYNTFHCLLQTKTDR